MGNAPSSLLFDKIKIAKKEDIDVARSFNDYNIMVDNVMPDGVELIEKI